MSLWLPSLESPMPQCGITMNKNYAYLVGGEEASIQYINLVLMLWITPLYAGFHKLPSLGYPKASPLVVRHKDRRYMS